MQEGGGAQMRKVGDAQAEKSGEGKAGDNLGRSRAVT